MESAEIEFPFAAAVEDKPGSLAWARKQLGEFERLNQEHGCLLTGAQAAEVLGVTRVYVRELAFKGKLRRFDLPLGAYYSGNDVLAHLKGKAAKGKVRLLAGMDKSP